MMYIDMVDPFYNATLFELTPNNLGPFDDGYLAIKSYLSLLNEFVLNFSAKGKYPDSEL